MKRIVWLFGDGSTQYTPLDPQYRREGEDEEKQLTRMQIEYPKKLHVTNIRPDLTIRTPTEQAEYEASLGAGAVCTFAGLVSEEEYMDKFNRLRCFREAWTWTSTEPVIDIDMGKCRERKRGDLRRARTPLLQALDIEYQRADERGDAAAKVSIAARKQALRDVTIDPAIEAAQTPEELKAELAE